MHENLADAQKSSPRGTDASKEIVKVRYNHFQNKRKFLINKIADELSPKKDYKPKKMNISQSAYSPTPRIFR